jgi:hypothetical protein
MPGRNLKQRVRSTKTIVAKGAPAQASLTKKAKAKALAASRMKSLARKRRSKRLLLANRHP